MGGKIIRRGMAGTIISTIIIPTIILIIPTYLIIPTTIVIIQIIPINVTIILTVMTTGPAVMHMTRTFIPIITIIAALFIYTNVEGVCETHVILTPGACGSGAPNSTS